MMSEPMAVLERMAPCSHSAARRKHSKADFVASASHQIRGGEMECSNASVSRSISRVTNLY
jgi:hypothetical protein